MGFAEESKAEVRRGGASPGLVVAESSDSDERSTIFEKRQEANVVPVAESDPIPCIRTVNACAPFNKLPIELVIVVLRLSVSKRDLFKHSDYRRLYRLASVSVRWWDIIRHTPQFWTTLQLDMPEIAAICLQRSSPLPIDIHWPVVENKPLEPSKNTLIVLHRIIGEYLVARIELLKLSTLHAKYWIPILVESLPSLKFLSVEHDSQVSAPFQWPAAAVERCPQLEGLRLFNVSFPLTRGFSQTLSKLVIGRMDEAMSNEGFLAILPQLPRLRSLRLVGQTVEGLRSSQEGSSVVLPSLKSLELNNIPSSAIRFVFNCFLTPALNLISIQWAHYYFWDTDEEEAVSTVMNSVFYPRDATNSPATAALRNSSASEVVLTHRRGNKIQVSTDSDCVRTTGLHFILDTEKEWPVAGAPTPDIEFTLFKDVCVRARLDHLLRHNSPQTFPCVNSRILYRMPTTTIVEYFGVAGDALERAIRFLIPDDEDAAQACPALQKINIFRPVEELNCQEGVIEAIGELLEKRRASGQGPGSGLTVWSRGRSQFDENEVRFVGAGEDLPCTSCDVPNRRLPRREDW